VNHTQHSFPLPLIGNEQSATTAAACACDGYVRAPAGGGGKVVAIDCEMVRTNDGKLSLAWLVALDEHDNILVNTLVKPSLPVVDHLTRFSGVCEETVRESIRFLKIYMILIIIVVISWQM